MTAPDPPARRERLSVEAIGAVGATAGAVWAGLVEYLPPAGKAIGGAAVGTIGAIGAVKLWRDKRKEQQQRREGNN